MSSPSELPHVSASQLMGERNRLSSEVLGTADIVFMVIAAAAPMAVVVAIMPMAFGFGNGAGVAGAWLCALAAMLLFAVGYVRIIPHVVNAGAFYAYIAASIGKPFGLAAAYVAALSYFSLSASTLGALSYFAEQFFHEMTGRTLPWELWGLTSVAIVAWLSYRRITVAAKLLGIALMAEVSIILLLDFKIIFDVGLSKFEYRVFAPSAVFSAGVGITAIYAFNSMIGIEGTAIYQEEARNRSKTIPRATYLALVSVGLFYVLTAWCLTSSLGMRHVAAVARSDPGNFIIDRSTVHLGQFGALAVSLLVLTSSFAAVLALFNNAARYLYSLARDGALPKALARTHPRYQSPHIAGANLAVALVGVIALSALANLDPLLTVVTAFIGVGSVGLMALLAVTSLAIPVYFAKRHVFTVPTILAPGLGGLAIGSATIIAFLNYSAITGVNSTFINHLSYSLVLVAVWGFGQALWLRRERPEIYLRIGSSRIEE